MNLPQRIRSTVSGWFAAKPAAPAAPAHPLSMRSYAGAQIGRLTGDWNPLNTSADSEIITSLRTMRARSRQLVRDNDYAKRIKQLMQINIVGQGIGMQAQVANSRSKLQDKINSTIETAWEEWSNKESCHTAGLLAFPDIERMLVGELFEAGEVLVRMVHQKFGDRTKAPLALEIIEAERLIDTWQTAKAPNGNAIRMGVEVDQWQRPVAYWLHPNHPGDYQFTSFQPARFIRVPADEIIHLYIVDRIPQTRGVPWMHAVLKRLNDMGGYSEAEIVRARGSAAIMGFLETPETEPGDGKDDDGTPVMDMEPGTIKQLLPGQKFSGFDPSSPNAVIEPFMRFMLRGAAAGTGTSYESVSRDYSQSNYSSSRLALLDDRAMWCTLQFWLIRNFRTPVHRAWMSASVLGGDIAIADFYTQRARYEAVRFRPRGWSWIDPVKEVAAYEAAVQAGFMTMSQVISMTSNGQDFEEILKERRAELDRIAELGLDFTTNAAPAKVAVAPGVALNDSAAPGTPENQGDPNAPDANQDLQQQQEAA